MPQRHPQPPARTSRARKSTPPRRLPGGLSLLLLWPFHLFNLFTWPFRPLARFGLRLVGYPLVAALYGGVLLAIIYGLRSRTYDLGKLHAMPERSLVLDRMGEELGRIHAAEKRSLVPLAHVSEHFRKAIVAREDERFYHHPGMDPVGMVRALFANLRGKREGASTITQQLASDVFRLKDGEKRGAFFLQLDRKFLEIAIACRIEMAMKKDEILEAYINQINWGRQIRGISEASRVYFERHPAELTLSEGAMLAGIVRGPDAFNPFKSLDAAIRERDSTLERMVAARAISRAEADAAKTEPIEIRPRWRREARDSYAMDAIRRELEHILEKENIAIGGLTIHTTIDLRLQQKGEESLDRKLRSLERIPGYPHQTRSAWHTIPEDRRGEPAYIQGSAVIVENRTGAVLAVVGGRDANESKFNRAIQGPGRQIGSLFKPFVYQAAFGRGLRPDTSISDGPIRPGEIRGAGNWRPHNSDGRFGGLFPASYGLIRSRNTMSVRVGNFAGVATVAETAAAAGFTTQMPHSPAAFLGTWEATPWEIASAYTVFPNEGARYKPYLVAEIRDSKGNVLYSCPPQPQPALKAGPSWAVSRILTEVTTRGTAASVSRLGFDKPCGGKTGTTNQFKDAWFAGFTSNLTCAVWVGLDTPKTTIQGGYGSTLALPVWVDIMKTADRLGYKAGRLDTRVALVDCELCRLSGRRATEGCREAATAYHDNLPADSAPEANELCPVHPARALVFNDDGSPASADPAATPPRALPLGDHLAPPPPRAIPLDDEIEYDPPPPLAIPLEENEPYDTPADPPRAIPVE
jgi:penicillin-binding protein 1A